MKAIKIGPGCELMIEEWKTITNLKNLAMSSREVARKTKYNGETVRWTIEKYAISFYKAKRNPKLSAYSRHRMTEQVK